MEKLTDQQTKALAAFRGIMASNSAALGHFDRVAPELARRLADPPLTKGDDRDPHQALVWDWFNAHYPGSPASTDAVLWDALVKGAVPKLIAALASTQSQLAAAAAAEEKE
jgi:hypothetical protein